MQKQVANCAEPAWPCSQAALDSLIACAASVPSYAQPALQNAGNMKAKQ